MCLADDSFSREVPGLSEDRPQDNLFGTGERRDFKYTAFFLRGLRELINIGGRFLRTLPVSPPAKKHSCIASMLAVYMQFGNFWLQILFQTPLWISTSDNVAENGISGMLDEMLPQSGHSHFLSSTIQKSVAIQLRTVQHLIEKK